MTTGLLGHSSPRWGGEENGKNKANLMGQYKGGSTEQQKAPTITTTILIRRIYKKRTKYTGQLSHRLITRELPSCEKFPPSQLPTGNGA